MARIPEQLGPLKLVQQIGWGRQCQVWQAVESPSGRAVAVKIPVPGAGDDAGRLKLLEHECKVAKSLDHPTIIVIDRLCTGSGPPHLVMELFPHPNLRKQLAGGVAALVPRLQRIVTEIGLALEHMHARGWVHRDLKPENVLADPQGQVKLIDFEIATKSAGLLGRLLGGKTTAQGSPSYVSPEQIRGEVLDARSDIYSYGCVLFELVAGRPPFVASNPNDLFNKHVSAAPPAVDAFNQQATTGGAAFLRQLLAKKPGDRPASMREVLQQLRSIRLVQQPG